MSLNTTIAWTYTEIALYAVLTAVASILFSIESRTMYLSFHDQDTDATKLSTEMQDSEPHPSEYNKQHGTPESVACNPPSTDVPPIPNNTERTECSECNTRTSPPSSPQRTVSAEIDTKTQTAIVIQRGNSVTKSSRQQSSKSQGPPKQFLRLQILSLLMFGFFVACGISAILFKLGIGVFADCAPCGVQGSFYTAAKVMMYFIFIYRLYAIYSNSMFQFRTWTLSVLGVICILFWSVMAIANVWTVTSVLVPIGGETFCGCQTVLALAGGILLFDTVISLLCCWLFIRPLRVLNLLGGGHDEELYETVLKCTILTIVTVLSTILIMVAILMLYLTGLVALDATINCVCVFLFNSKYDAVYKVLCCGPRKCCCVKKN